MHPVVPGADDTSAHHSIAKLERGQTEALSMSNPLFVSCRGTAAPSGQRHMELFEGLVEEVVECVCFSTDAWYHGPT